MGVTITCTKCGQTGRYTELHNIGTSLSPVFTVRCRYCNETYIENDILVSSENNKIEFPKKTRDQTISELETLLVKKRFPEVILQQYFSEEYQHYGFTDLEGPFPRGPDFYVTRNGKIIKLELETDEYNYILHGHHKSKAFKKVEILVYLTHNNRIDKFSRLIPKERTQLEKEHFWKWYWLKNEQNVYVDNLTFRINKVFNEYVNVFEYEICDKKDSSMSFCPHCLNCGYFSEDIVLEFTGRYLKKHKELLTMDDYDFSLINRESLLEVIYD